jgi:CubicO group peptidase (beta-lactamase class C family)
MQRAAQIALILALAGCTSISKQFTAAVILLLVEDGQLRLTDPAASGLPARLPGL